MALVSVSPSSLPARSAGKTSVPEAEQTALFALVAKGQAASDGRTYKSQKAAAQAGGPYARLLRARIRDGKMEGRVVLRTWHDGQTKGGDVHWAVAVLPA